MIWCCDIFLLDERRSLWANHFYWEKVYQQTNAYGPLSHITHLKTFNVKFCLFGVYLPTQEFFTNLDTYYHYRWRASNFLPIYILGICTFKWNRSSGSGEKFVWMLSKYFSKSLLYPQFGNEFVLYLNTQSPSVDWIILVVSPWKMVSAVGLFIYI